MTDSSQKLPYNPANLTVIVIDDQDPIRKAIRRVLTNLGFGTVLEFFDGADALKAINKQKIPIDLIITDLYMRRANGFQVLKKIRSKDFSSDIPVIVVTGEGSKEDIIQAVDAGADDYLLKPFQVADIAKKVATVLTNYHSPPPMLKLIREGERLLSAGEFQDALKVFEAAQRLEPQSARAQYLRALTLDGMGHPDDALNLLKESSANNSTFYKNYAAMANIYLKLGQKLLAIESLKSELELNPKQGARQALIARMLLTEGDSLGAIDHFREALKENSKARDALLGIGEAYEQSGNCEKGIYYYKRARRNHPNSTKALELIVKSFERRGEPKKALSQILEEVNAAPNKADARIIAAQLHSKFGEIEKALKVIDDGILREPQSIPLLKAKAKALMASKDTLNACVYYQKIVILDSSSNHYTLLGHAFLHDRQYDKAAEALQAALQGSIDKQRILTLLAEVYKRCGNPLQAAITLSLARKHPGKISELTITADIKLFMDQVNERRRGIPAGVKHKAS